MILPEITEKIVGRADFFTSFMIRVGDWGSLLQCLEIMEIFKEKLAPADMLQDFVAKCFPRKPFNSLLTAIRLQPINSF